MRIDVDRTALSESGIALSKSIHQNKEIVIILSDIICPFTANVQVRRVIELYSLDISHIGDYFSLLTYD